MNLKLIKDLLYKLHLKILLKLHKPLGNLKEFSNITSCVLKSLIAQAFVRFINFTLKNNIALIVL